MTSQKYTILYGRLSQDDGKTVESNSVTNQRLLLERSVPHGSRSRK